MAHFPRMKISGPNVGIVCILLSSELILINGQNHEKINLTKVILWFGIVPIFGYSNSRVILVWQINLTYSGIVESSEKNLFLQ